jgi:hypothetical protein
MGWFVLDFIMHVDSEFKMRPVLDPYVKKFHGRVIVFDSRF